MPEQSASVVPPAVASVDRIGVILHGALGEIPALRMLLLHMNALQSDFVFELLPNARAEVEVETDPPVPTTRPFAGLRLFQLLDQTRPREEDFDVAVESFADEYDRLLENVERGESCWPYPRRLGYVVLSTTKLMHGYFVSPTERTVVVALGDWAKEMAPPSIVEFAVTLTVSAVGQLLLGELDWSNHYGTRACIFDYTDDLKEARYQVIEGLICPDCAAILSRRGATQNQIDVLRRLASRKWLLEPRGKLSPAATAKALRYDLFVTKGLAPTVFQRITSFLNEEGVRIFGKWLVAGLLAYIAYKLGVERYFVGKPE